MSMRRIIAGMGANSFGMAVTIGIQLLSLPLFLHYWNAETYGTWLMLSAIPSYLSMADAGMVTAAGNRMTMAMGRGDLEEANRVFQSAQSLMFIVCGGIAAITLPALAFLPLPAFGSADQRIALAALCIGVLLSLFGGLSEAVFRSTQRYAIGTMLGNLTRLGEWVGCMIGLVLYGSFSAIALGGLAARLLGLMVTMLLSSRGSYGLHWGIKSARRHEIAGMLKPALSFMVFPLANALSFQGITLLVGGLAGAASVAVFNTYRTIARIAVQITAVFSYALGPEFSMLFGKGDIGALHRLVLRSSVISAIQAVVLSTVVYFAAPLILRLWTHGVIAFVPPLMIVMLAYAAIGGIWHVPKSLLTATNHHARLAVFAIVFALLCVGSSWLLERQHGLEGVAAGMLISELGIAAVCSWLAYRFMTGQLAKARLST